MPHPSKRKGNRFERELVHDAERAGLTAERAYASDGRALGCAETVDVLVHAADGTPWKVQAKRRKSVASYLTPPDGADVTVVREDRADALAIVPWNAFLRMLASAPGGGSDAPSAERDAGPDRTPASADEAAHGPRTAPERGAGPLFDGLASARALYGGPDANP
jgi:hypothetical protein